MTTARRQFCLRVLVALALLLLSGGQELAAQDQAEIPVEAVLGQPFGVGKLTVPANMPEQLSLTETHGRTLYPVYVTDSVRVEGGGEPSRQARMYFLFQGKDPLDLALETPYQRVSVKVEVQQDQQAQLHQRLLNEWWSLYRTRAYSNGDAYPQWMDDYLVRMLAQRMKLEPPKVNRSAYWSPDVDLAIGLLTGAESVRVALQAETFLKPVEEGEATERLPDPDAPPAVAIPDPGKDVVVEPLAFHVPEECFYLRCADWNEFQWFRKTVDKWGGDLRNLIADRGLDYGIREKIERQLAVKETALAKVFGGLAVEDTAFIGTDFFLREGAAIGILFHARNNGLLSAQIERQRAEAEKALPGVTRSEVKIGEHSVSLLATPQHTVRSFYAVDGDYHLVTNSRYLVGRFYEASQGKNALGGLKEFRYARKRNPGNPENAVFIYLSDPFFRNLIHPRYRVEMTRRMKAGTELDLVQLASLAARAEGAEMKSVEELVKEGFLPERFGRRPDGSHVVVEDGRRWDSLRGATGTFLPIPDVDITKVTRAEVVAFKAFAEFYRAQWQRTDPVMVAIKHQALAEDREKITLDVHILPYAQQKYSTLRMLLGASDVAAIGRGPKDLVFLECPLNGWGTFPGRNFLGIQDVDIPFVYRDDRIVECTSIEPKAYMGAAPPAVGIAFEGVFPEGLQADNDGIVRKEMKDKYRPEQFWWRNSEFALMGTSRDVLLDRIPSLKLTEMPRPAQLRLHIGDLSKAQVRHFLDACLYAQARKTSDGNLALLRTLQQQFGVGPRQALRAGEDLLGARMTCPLGGKYELDEGQRDGTEPFLAWYAVLPEGCNERNYHSELLDWVRGVDLEFQIDNTSLSTHTEIELHNGRK
jgi:hypothetical protein